MEMVKEKKEIKGRGLKMVKRGYFQSECCLWKMV